MFGCSKKRINGKHVGHADINRQQWHNEINVNSRYEFDKTFKDKLLCEQIITLLNIIQRILLCKLNAGILIQIIPNVLLLNLSWFIIITY